jgi:flagellar biosynthesis/type III secretory pathway protein FliH
MNEAINAYNSITVSPEFRELERARAYARHNEASALGHARREGEAKGIAKGMEEGMAKGMEQGIAKGMEQGIAKGMEQERKKWQAEIERLRAELDRK